MARTVKTLEILAIRKTLSPSTVIFCESGYCPNCGAVWYERHSVVFADVTSIANEVTDVFHGALPSQAI